MVRLQKGTVYQFILSVDQSKDVQVHNDTWLRIDGFSYFCVLHVFPIALSAQFPATCTLVVLANEAMRF